MSEDNYIKRRERLVEHIAQVVVVICCVISVIGALVLWLR